MFQEYYRHSRDTTASANKDAFGNPSAVAVPNLQAFNVGDDSGYGPIEGLKATAIFSAAPDVDGGTNGKYKSLGEETILKFLCGLKGDAKNNEAVRDALLLRWQNTLKACVENEITDFFTGMFGTGMFGNAHGVVSDALAEALATEIGKDKDDNPVRYCDVVSIHLTGIKDKIKVYEEGVKKEVEASKFWGAKLIKDKILEFSGSSESKV